MSENWAGTTSVLLHGMIVAAVIMLVNPPIMPTMGEAPVPITLVNLTPPAAPPPPLVQNETPPPITTAAQEVPDTTPVKKPRPKHEIKKPIDQPPVVDAAPSTAPPSAAPPSEMPVQQPQANPSPSYLSLVSSQLERNKVYPHVARIRKEQGTALLRFVVDRNGRVLTHQIDQSSGHGDLDHEVEEMLNRAQPLPVMPPEMTQAQIEIVVPIKFYLR